MEVGFKKTICTVHEPIVFMHFKFVYAIVLKLAHPILNSCLRHCTQHAKVSLAQ
jgi:hypothetical protein